MHLWNGTLPLATFSVHDVFVRKEDRSTQWHAPYAVDISLSLNTAVMKSFHQTVVVDSQRSMEEKFTMGLTVAAAQQDLDHYWSDRWVDQCVIDSC
eukprot:508695-Amphidinium_carterae.1